MAESVLDASALLAFMQDEDGAAAVEIALQRGCAISAVNLAEVLSKVAAAGADPEVALGELSEIADALELAPLVREDLIEIAKLLPATRKLGLSLADRACLALSLRLELPALTTDRAWAEVELPGLAVRLIR